jgi:hypothetical protein
MDPKEISNAALDAIAKGRFGKGDITEFIKPVRAVISKLKCDKGNKSQQVPKSYDNWPSMNVKQKLRFLNACYALDGDQRREVVQHAADLRKKEEDDRKQKEDNAPTTANEKLRMLMLRSKAESQMLFQNALGLYLTRTELEQNKKYTKVDAEAGDQAWAALTEAYNDPCWEPQNPVIGGESDSGQIYPVGSCSQSQFVRLKDMDPQDYRWFTKAQCQDCYRGLKGPLTKVLAGYNASGKHDGDFTTPTGTDEWARFCQSGENWLEAACFVLEKPEMMAMGKLHSTEWYVADTTWVHDDESRKGLISRHFSSMRAQANADRNLMRTDNSEGTESVNSFSPGMTPGLNRRGGGGGGGRTGRRGDLDQSSSNATIGALHGIMDRLGSGGGSGVMTADKQMDMLKFIVTTSAPTDADSMQMKAYQKLCGMVMPTDV